MTFVGLNVFFLGGGPETWRNKAENFGENWLRNSPAILPTFARPLEHSPQICSAESWDQLLSRALCRNRLNFSALVPCPIQKIRGPKIGVAGFGCQNNEDLCPPPGKYYENTSPRIFLCNFWGRLWQNCVITKKFIPQALFCIIGDRRDLRLFHVELRDIYVTPKRIFLRDFFCAIDYAKRVAITPKVIPQDFLCM